jgi:hypothetical protein
MLTVNPSPFPAIYDILIKWWYQCGTRNFRPRNGVSTMTKLTNKLIADLPIKPATYIVWDDETKGLGIRINDNRQFH